METTGYPFCLVHEFINLFTGSPDPSSRAAQRSSVFAFEQACLFMYEASDFYFHKQNRQMSMLNLEENPMQVMSETKVYYTQQNMAEEQSHQQWFR